MGIGLRHSVSLREKGRRLSHLPHQGQCVFNSLLYIFVAKTDSDKVLMMTFLLEGPFSFSLAEKSGLTSSVCISHGGGGNDLFTLSMVSRVVLVYL